jgi:two-component system chemotaxis response regulator CheB
MEEHHRVIVMGASAGGVRALLRLAPQLNPNFGAPILLVVHIGRNRSHLPELLTAKGPNPAVFARSGMIPQPGTIYVAPSDEHLLLEKGALRVFHGPKVHHARPAIDPLFRSAAIDVGARAIGVILTGMLDDGSAGLHAIKACGGIAVVQDPADAAEPSMPKSALAATSVDHVARLDDMADLLNSLAEPSGTPISSRAPGWLLTEHAVTLGKAGLQELKTIGTPSAMTCPDCGGGLFELKEGRPPRFLCHTGHAFSLVSLASAQEQVADEALWSALRALQEKEALLRRMAEESDLAGQSALLAQANNLAAYIVLMRRAVEGAPASSAEPPSNDDTRST